jgi:hypothetical protein
MDAAAVSCTGMPQASQKRAPGVSSLSQWGHFTAVPSFLEVWFGFPRDLPVSLLPGDDGGVDGKTQQSVVQNKNNGAHRDSTLSDEKCELGWRKIA